MVILIVGLTYAAEKHLCARHEAFYLLQFAQGLTVDHIAHQYCDNKTRAKTLSWNITGDCCEWDGVTCNRFTGHVIGLDLSCSSLSGTINANSSLTKLGHLQRLNLAFNYLDDNYWDDFPLRNSISKLSSLTHLNLSDSGMDTQILPGLSNLSKLISLDLSWNYIQVGRTTFTSLLQNLTNLEVPDSTGNLHSLCYLNLQNCSLSGPIPESIGNLTAITELTLSSMLHCHFQGSFPESIGNLTNIIKLTLQCNKFTGTVPSTISKLNKLVVLDLSFNHFQGSIPESIGNLTAITQLTLSINSFTGNVPSSFRKLNKLHSLSLSLNNFEGPIPDIFANFSELDTLDFKRNNFTGPFPYSIATLTRLGSLELQNNSLTGPLPSNISGLQELYYLDLSFNYFTGTTPPWLFHLPSLINLYVQHNQFTGLPNELTRSSSDFTDVNLLYNQLYGEIPDWILSLRIHSLDISHNFLTGFEKQNNFSGSIPGCLGTPNSYIFIIDLRMNNFHGEIPRFLHKGLQYLGVYGNQLRGQVPRSLVNCTSLVALDLGNNKLNDTFPIWLEKLPNLQVLILKSNLFHSPIGDLESQFPFPELQIFDLSCNGFTGTLSSNLFKSFRGMMNVDEEKTASTSTDTDYLYHISLVIKGNEYDMRITSIMMSVDLSSNRFEGGIPNSIGSLSSLVLLNLSHNSFRGHIPAEFAKLQALEALDLSWNRLIGEIPGPLSSLTFLEVLNLSYNHLAGRIPIGKQFNTFPNDSYCGNPDLCGFPLSKECGNKNELPLEHDDDDDDSFFMSGFTWEAVVIGYGCGMLFGLLIGGLMFLLEKPKWYVNFAEDIAQHIAANKRTRQKKRRQRRGLRMN
ncbi:hypothetical protein KY285_033811 [Solanum tuberosum]|nr:hypothetical protein KY285_033811 [Solanum tuberosum]